MITFLTILCSLGILMLITILTGEFFADRNKESKFSIWWRKHIVGCYEDIDFQMRTLVEIELDYIRDIIEYFCRYYTTMYINKPPSLEITNLISKQINDRLLITNLIIDYKVQVNIYPKDEMRDSIIDNILEDKNILEDNVVVYYQRRRGDSIKELKYKI